MNGESMAAPAPWASTMVLVAFRESGSSIFRGISFTRASSFYTLIQYGHGGIPGQAEFPHHPRAGARHATRQGKLVRRPSPRGAQPALRPAHPGRRGPGLLGGAQGVLLRPRRQEARRAHRGPPHGVHDIRGTHPEGPVRRRHNAHLGYRGVRGEEVAHHRGSPGEGGAEAGAERPAPARRVAPGADKAGGREELAPVQGARPLRRIGKRPVRRSGHEPRPAEAGAAEPDEDGGR